MIIVVPVGGSRILMVLQVYLKGNGTVNVIHCLTLLRKKGNDVSSCTTVVSTIKVIHNNFYKTKIDMRMGK